MDPSPRSTEPVGTHFDSLLDVMSDAVLVYPLTSEGPGPLLAFNRAALDTYGYSASELESMTVRDIVSPYALDVTEAIRQLRETRQASFESEHVRKDGSTFPVQTNARLIEYGGQLCVLAVCRDDDERRRFQNDVLRANLRLERAVENRTANLEAYAEDLRILHRISTDEHASAEDRYDAYLRAGCEMFDLPIGILSETPASETGEHREYRVAAVVTPDPSIHVGLTVPLREAFCDRVIETGGTVTYSDAAHEAPDHPACRVRGLRAFIGAPIQVRGRLFGTVNFVSPESRPAGFSAAETSLIEVMAAALGRQLALDHAEAESQRALAWYRAVSETVDAAIVVVDPDGTVRDQNEAARDVLGVSEGTPRLPASRLSGSGQPFLEQPETTAVLEGRAVRNVLQGVPSEDGILWFNVCAAPVDEDLDGIPDRAMVVFQDVTPLRNEIERSERYGRLLASVLDASADGIMAFHSVRDESGEIVDFEWVLVNPRAEEIVGRRREDLLGRLMLDVFPGNVESGFFEGYKSAVETGERFETTLEYTWDGFETAFRVSAVPLRSEDGFTVTFSTQEPEQLDG